MASAVTCFVFPGDQVAVYSELCYPTALHGVAFHPHENMVAFCAFGQSQPVHVYLYDRKGLFSVDPAPEYLTNILNILVKGATVFESLKYTVLIFHIVSQLEVHSIKAVSRSASVDPKTVRNTPDLPVSQDRSASSAMDQFAQSAKLALKMQCVKEQLDSVLVNTPSLLLSNIL